MNNWETVSFENAPLEIIDGDRGSNYPKQSDFMASGHCLFLNAGNVTEIGFNFSDCSFISEAKDNKLRKGKLARHDIVLTTRGTVGNLAYYDDRIPFENVRLNSGMVIIRPNKERIFPRYLYFLLKSSIFSEQVSAFTTGSAQPQLPIRDIKRIEFSLPPLPEQRLIAGTLGALDDKIELNRRINRTLEAMARAVFSQWFVESEDRKKWDELNWGDIATLEYGKSLSDYKDSNAPYIVYGTNGPIGKHTEPLYPSEGIIIGRKGAYRGIHYSPDPFFVIDTAFYLKPQKPFSMKWAYYELLQFDLNGMDSGSAIPSTSRTDFYNIPVLFPPLKLMTSFEEFVTPLVSKIYANEKETRTLASLRDSLLPKLMRGEVRVKDVEE